jgi:hypothetical protein
MKPLILVSEADKTRATMSFYDVLLVSIVQSPDHRLPQLIVYDGILRTPWCFPLNDGNLRSYEAWRAIKDAG